MAMLVVTPACLAIVLAAITPLWTALANGMTPRGRLCNCRSACSSHAAKKPSKSMYSCSGAVGFRPAHHAAQIANMHHETPTAAHPCGSKLVALLFSDLGIAASHSRPRVSNDNPFSEAQFRTFKYRPEFPDRFAALEHARAHLPRFVCLVQRRAPSTAASATSRRPTCTLAAPRRSSRSVTAPVRRPTPPIPSGSYTGHHAQKRCPQRCGSINRQNRPARMPQNRRSSPRPTLCMGSLPGGGRRSISRRFTSSIAWSRYRKC